MGSNVITYDVIMIKDDQCDDKTFLKYCTDTISTIVGYNRELSVKIVMEMLEHQTALVFTHPQRNRSIKIRDCLISCGLNCNIRIVEDNITKS